MNVTITQEEKIGTDSKKIMVTIAIDPTDVQHIPSLFELQALETYNKTKKDSDLLFYLSEIAVTDEERKEVKHNDR